MEELQREFASEQKSNEEAQIQNQELKDKVGKLTVIITLMLQIIFVESVS